MMKYIFAIHGAFSSPKIFNYLKTQLGPTYHWRFLNYQDETGGFNKIINSIPDFSEPHYVIGHSMGGLMALGIFPKPWVRSITTIATPLGGVDVNLMQQYLSRSEFMSDINSHGDLIQKLSKIQTNKPVQHLISTNGFNPWVYEPNDGVVTLRSQRAYNLGVSHDIPSNHAEVMLNELTVDILRKFWN